MVNKKGRMTKPKMDTRQMEEKVKKFLENK